MNSSIAASMIACRRSAARSARLGFASGAETTLVSLARAALLAIRRLVDAEGLVELVRALLMILV
jgi:hypothetical protein